VNYFVNFWGPLSGAYPLNHPPKPVSLLVKEIGRGVFCPTPQLNIVVLIISINDGGAGEVIRQASSTDVIKKKKKKYYN